MGDKVKFNFTQFFTRSIDYSYTVKVVEIPDLVAYGTVYDKCVEEIKRAIIKVISRMDPDDLSRIKFIPGGRLETVDVEFQPTGKSGRRRKTKVRVKFSIIVIPHKEQLLVIVPKLKPPLKFYVDDYKNLQRVAQDELKEYFYDSTAEEIMKYEYDEMEKIEIINITAQVRSPLQVWEDKEEEALYEILETGENLVAKARAGELTRAYDRDNVVQKILDILASPEHESILLIGPSQVGKTAIINEVAYRIAKKMCQESLQGREIWQMSIDSIIAFSVYWQRTFKFLVKCAREENLIIYFEDIVRLLEGIGMVTYGDEIARFLKGPIENGEIQIVAEITPELYEKYLLKNIGFLSLFKAIRILPSDEEHTYKILNSVRKELELKNDISINKNAIDAAVEVTKRFRPYTVFPGKAITLLKQAVNSLQAAKTNARVLTKEHIFEEFSKQTGLPTAILSEIPPLDLEQVKQFFTRRIIGQEHAVNGVIDLICKIKAGLNDPEKPLGTFIFLGPTGVGKTYLAKLLAEYLFGSAERLIRLDMSEYSGGDAIYKLLGTPGSRNERGILTQKIIEQPFSLILLDEIEKAHSSVFDMLLQVTGEGRLTDASGTTVDFRSAAIIMTSNLGASHREISSIGFLEKGISVEQYFIEKLEEFFKPEFINRIDYIIVFNPLSKDEAKRIAEKELNEIISRYGFVRRRVNIEIDDQIIELIAEKGFSPVYGARPLKRTIEKLVIAPIAQYLAAHRDEEIGLLRISRAEDRVVVKSLSVKDPQVKISLVDPLVRKYVKLSWDKLLLEIGEQRRILEGIEQSEKIEELRHRMGRLLKKTRKRIFSKMSEEEKKELNLQIYYIDRILNKLRECVSEINFLEDLTDEVDKEHDTAYISEIAERFDDLKRKVAYLETEIAYAHMPEVSRGLLLIKRIGEKYIKKGEADWLRFVFNMYLQWLVNKGYTYSIYELVLPEKEEGEPEFKSLTFSEIGELKEYIDGLLKPVMFLFYIRGPNIYGFMQSEIGIHRFIGKLPGENVWQTKYRMVSVDCLQIKAESSLENRLKEIIEEAKKKKKEKNISWLEAFDTISSGDLEIAREYRWDDEKREVIDKKTGIRTQEIKKVLAGEIDPFILTYLKSYVLSLEEL